MQGSPRARQPAPPPSSSLFGNFIDHDGEMKLDFEEFVAMQPMRIRELHTRDTLREWYEAADEDHSGKLTINEFFSWSLNSSQVGGASVLERIFRKYDVDNSGSIGKDEFKRMAYDLGFGHMAHEAFAVLDNDRSGSITYREVLAALKKDVPFNLEVKKFLFGAIFSWGAEDGSGGGKAEAKPKVNTRGWRIRGSEVPEVLEELRALLNGSGAHISDLANIFDEDAGSILSIDEVEFSKQLRRWGFIGMPHTLSDVFAAINTSRSGKIDYDEFFEFVRGYRHALDARARNEVVRALSLSVPPDADFELAEIAWDVEPSAFDSVESLRILMQQMLLRSSITPSDLLRAWDRSGDKQLDKREFVSNVKRLVRSEPHLWMWELHRVADHAFSIIQADGSDVDSGVMDVIELEQWLHAPIRRKPEALLPLKPHRKSKEPPPAADPVKVKVPPRPGCDIQSRADKAIVEARRAAADKVARLKAHSEEQSRRFEMRWERSAEELKQSGMKWSSVPWEAPIAKKGDEKGSKPQGKQHGLPQLTSPRARRAGGGSGEASPRLSGEVHMPPLAAAGEHDRSPHQARRGAAGSPKRERGGGRSRPWVDESGGLHLPSSYRDAVKLTPKQLGALTAACCRSGITPAEIWVSED